jgi:phospholipase D-like protein
MKLLTSPARLERALAQLLDRYRRVSFAVAWASDKFPGYQQLKKHRRKIDKAIIGIHFYQTDPEFIDEFIDDRRVHFITSPSGVFHPKFYLFENSSVDWTCLLGSANFTRGGFLSNIEACVEIDNNDDARGTVRAGLDRAIKKYWGLEDRLLPDELENYKRMRRRFRQRVKPFLGGFGQGKSGRSILRSPLLGMGWPEYFNEVRKDEFHAIQKRVRVLEGARQLFERYSHFRQMPPDARKGIAGIADTEDVPWGWFGSMFGAGIFKSRVKKNDRNLSDALDAIPLTGDVSKTEYLAFIAAYRKAFPHMRGHGLGTATRLLAMKRPDHFVCLDAANKRGLHEAFGITLHRHEYERYWDGIIEHIRITDWWNSRAPATRTKRGFGTGGRRFWTRSTTNRRSRSLVSPPHCKRRLA